MYTSFYIKESRLDELKKYIRENLPSVRFKHNPLKEGDKWFIALNLEVEDNNKLSVLQNKWFEEDKPIKPIKKSFITKIKNYFKKYEYK